MKIVRNYGLKLTFCLLMIGLLIGCATPIDRIEVISVVDLGTLPGGANSSAQDINSNGYIVGRSEIAGGDRHAFLFSTASGMNDLGVLTGGNDSSALGVNSHNQVVGWSELLNPETGNVVRHGFIWDDGELESLGAYPPEGDIDSQSSARAINDDGLIGGNVDLAAVVWDLNGTPEHPPFPPTRRILFDGEFSPAFVTDINELGFVVGKNDSREAAFLNNTRRTQFYHGAIPNAYETTASALDPIGRAVGWASFHEPGRGSYNRAIYWPSFDSAIALGTLGGMNSWATDINGQQFVVGYSENADGNTQAFIWREDTGMQSLGTLGGDNSKAFAINNNGQVVGEAETASGEIHAVFWAIEYHEAPE